MMLFANLVTKIRLCNGEMLFLSLVCQAVLLIFVEMLLKARIESHSRTHWALRCSVRYATIMPKPMIN